MADPQEIAEMYDLKTTRTGLNRSLAEGDGLFFNHNGLVLPGETLEMYERSITDEKSRLERLHEIEQNLVRFGILYLGTPTEGMIGLDAGCGGGESGIMIHRSFGSTIEGFTLSPEQARYGNGAAENYGCSDKVRFHVGDMLNLERPKGSYDFIWVCESTEHAADLDAMFREFNRVAKSLSRLVIIAWCAVDPKLKEVVDNHYLTDIHRFDEYLESAQRQGWNLAEHVDLTGMTAPYWELRSRSENGTGAEEFMYSDFRDKGIEYHLLAFDKQTYC
ncbi:MAG: SAM-dependent methyltransferase [Candidatus Aenigmarchaeota archaeon CG_4_9_14_3_um_filter_37_18]|nr:MAG: SAM-dependent methyltransferase [Candidatus Aenigmarchaeota archaeon CG01_land_8_20_14_3_00_37_9]PIX50353.1 MAG: SAM-dependent methyltransferase [Candidatus Aenigmarchaeota archaeon CG_4_8_14_3_um_filter_37_24]PJB75779.1 MAG: SAM-dependent methyltransferase [Candidatus Aenigmarchaeota archaeon CG_4_9_14_3_um_filter_37_18]